MSVVCHRMGHLGALLSLDYSADNLANSAYKHPPASGLEVLYEEQDFRRYHSGQPTVFSGANIITVLRYYRLHVARILSILDLR